MKVDTNTKGNSYWFMFKVTNFRIGTKYTFNVMNFTRSMYLFYNNKMNILTKAESIGQNKNISEPIEPSNNLSSNGGEINDGWRYNTC
jgi:hypothetical protein